MPSDLRERRDSMRAMVLTGRGRLELQQIECPELHPEGVIARVEAVGICNATDLRVVDAEDPEQVWPNRPWPVVLGHELCGVVERVGPDVAGWQIGDRIAGWCPPCGGFAEWCQFYPAYMAAVKVPDDMAAEDAALLELSIGTARYFFPEHVMAVVRRARSALVLGLGPSGLLYVRECGLLGIPVVYASDRHETRRKLAAEMGAAEVFGGGDEPFWALSERGEQVDIVVDTTGKDLFGGIARVIRAGGAIVPFGVGFDWAANEAALTERDVIVSSANLEEGWSAAPVVLDWIRSSELPVSKLVTRRGTFEDIPEALEAIRARRDIKVVIRPG